MLDKTNKLTIGNTTTRMTKGCHDIPCSCIDGNILCDKNLQTHARYQRPTIESRDCRYEVFGVGGKKEPDHIEKKSPVVSSKLEQKPLLAPSSAPLNSVQYQIPANTPNVGPTSSLVTPASHPQQFFPGFSTSQTPYFHPMMMPQPSLMNRFMMNPCIPSSFITPSMMPNDSKSELEELQKSVIQLSEKFEQVKENK